MIKAVAYARFSSENQRDESIEAQLRAIHKFADENGYEINEEYIDRAKSGTNDRREEFQRMIADSALGDFEVVLIHKLDRFARNRYDSALYKRELRGNGVQLISVLEQFGEVPESIIMEGLLESMSEYYSANLSREVKKGQYENALACKHTGGAAPLGYRVNSELRYEIEEAEAEHVRYIYDCVLNGIGYGEIITSLNERGIVTRRGNPFGKNSLYEILRNEKYTGVYIYRRSSPASFSGKRNNHKSRNSDDIIRIEDGMPQIISREIFETVQQIMDRRKQGRSPRSTAKENYLLSGKIVCGVCGNTFCGNRIHSGRNKQLYVTYRCNTRSNKGRKLCENKDINRNYIEKYVLKLLAEVLFDEKRLPKVIEEYNHSVLENDEQYSYELKTLEKSIRKKKKEIDNLVNVIASTGSDALTAALAEREKELASLKTQRRELEMRSSTVDVDTDEITEAFRKGKELLMSGQLPRIKQLIELYVSRVEVYPEYVTVKLNYMPALQASASDGSLGQLGDTYEKALEFEESIDRKRLIREGME